MKVKFYGTRGSITVAEPEFQEFGGNTTCLLMTGVSGRIGILDAGSGIRKLGKDLIKDKREQFDNIYIGFTHFHWDHIQGLPFFKPAYDPDRHFSLSAIGSGRHGKDLKRIFQVALQQEFFPVPLDKMGAAFSYHQADENSITENEVTVSVSKHHHPGGAYGYRIEDSDGKVMVFCTDVEHTGGIDPNVVELARGADLLIHDAQFTPEELKSKEGWGHSSWEQAVAVAEQAGVKRLALTHHDPDHDDDFILKMEEACKKQFANSFFAREMSEIEI